MAVTAARSGASGASCRKASRCSRHLRAICLQPLAREAGVVVARRRSRASARRRARTRRRRAAKSFCRLATRPSLIVRVRIVAVGGDGAVGGSIAPRRVAAEQRRAPDSPMAFQSASPVSRSCAYSLAGAAVVVHLGERLRGKIGRLGVAALALSARCTASSSAPRSRSFCTDWSWPAAAAVEPACTATEPPRGTSDLGTRRAAVMTTLLTATVQRMCRRGQATDMVELTARMPVAAVADARPSQPVTRRPPRQCLPLVVLAPGAARRPRCRCARVNDVAGRERPEPELPAVAREPPRRARAFDPAPIEQLRYGDPEWVFIGDSMLGTRIDPQLLGEISGSGDRNVTFLFQAASGPAWWYLVVQEPSRRQRRQAARDVLLLPRHQPDRHDVPAAEPPRRRARRGRARAASRSSTRSSRRAQRGVWSRVDAAFNRLYEVDTRVRVAAADDPALVCAAGSIPDPAARLHFENVIEEDFNQNFRRDLAADIGAAEDDADFARDLPTSVLPLIMDLSNAHQLPVCFVRVQRRPVGNRPPPQSPALRRYVADFRAWAESQGACFHDETGDPELTLDLYEDGDHFARSRALHADLPRAARSALPMTFHSLPFVIFLPVVLGALLAAAASRARTSCCSPPATCSTASIHPWFVAIMLVSTTVDYWAGQRMEDDPAHKKRYLAGQPDREPRACSGSSSTSTSSSTTCALVLGVGRPRRRAADARDPAAGRHLVLHVPGAQLHHRHLSRRDARAPQPDRLRALRRVLPASGRRPDHARAEPAEAGGAAARVFGRRRAQRAPC